MHASLVGELIATIQSPKAKALQMTTNKNATETKNFSNEILPISIQSPFSGIVTGKFHFSGDVVASGEPIYGINKVEGELFRIISMVRQGF